MGVQTATARHLDIPELTTTVLTMTLTAIAADPALGDRRARTVRRALSVVATLLGALFGALLAIDVGVPEPLAVAAGLLVLTVVVAQRLSGSRAAWATA